MHQNLFVRNDTPTKILTYKSDASTLEFVCEYLHVHTQVLKFASCYASLVTHARV